MNIKRYVLPIFTALLIGIAALTTFRYIGILIERQNIENALEEAKGQLSRLEGEKVALNRKLQDQALEKEKLTQEKQTVEEALGESQNKYSLIEEQLMQAQKRIDDLDNNLERIEQENAALQESENKLTAQVEQLTQEKNALEQRFSSVKELKNAIRELKLKMRKPKIKIQLLSKNNETDTTIIGNCGYIIKNGEPTYPAKVKIEVTPAP